MTGSCPRCHATFIASRRRAQTTAASIGGIAGSLQGVSTAMAGANDSGYPLDVVAGAMLGGLRGGAPGFVAGSAIGAPIDQTLPANFRCQSCGHVFGVDRTDPALT